MKWRPRRFVRTVAVTVVLLPAVALAVGAGDLVLRIGAVESPLARVTLVQLAIAVPLATWVFASALEAVTAVLIAANRRHRAHAGVRITGL